MKNPYKRLDIFKCLHEAHDGFQSRMSVHHILNKKRCFPQGCYYFKRHCKLMKQGKKCYRGFKHIGKDCVGCRYFYEEKIHNRPELQIDQQDYDDFLTEIESFEDWLEERVNREMDIQGRVDGVKPLFGKRIFPKGESFSFIGFLIIFRQIYLGTDSIDDHVYLRLSPKTYAAVKFGRGDLLTGRATLTLDRGRLVLKRLRRFEITQRGEAPLWDASRALVARETSTLISTQPEGCMQCPYGALIDVEDFRRRETTRYRHLHCLKGMPDYLLCPEYPRYAGTAEAAPRLPCNTASCMMRGVTVASKRY